LQLVIIMLRLHCQSEPSPASVMLWGRNVTIAALAINNPKVRNAIVLMRMTEPLHLISSSMLVEECFRPIS
jgi:hypothetical protein